MKNFQFSIFNFQLLLVLLFLPAIAEAATFVIEIDTGTETINAVEGVIRLPADIKLSRLETGNSAVLLWIEPPTYLEKENTISFSGISPGGFIGRQTLFLISGEFGSGGLAGATFSGVRALRNDGEGGLASVNLSLHLASSIVDDAPPEPFELSISKSNDAFDGGYFVSFAAQDKGTGVKKYNYASAWILLPDADNWQEVESPLILSGADLFKKIYIRAIDHEGRYREVSTTGPYRFPAILVGLIIIICVLLLLRRSFYSRSL